MLLGVPAVKNYFQIFFKMTNYMMPQFLPLETHLCFPIDKMAHYFAILVSHS